MNQNVKPTKEQLGYGRAHQRERRRWERILEAEQVVPCARCPEPIHHGQAWDLGHTDDRTGWQGPEHVSCNRSAGGRNGAKVTNLKRNMKKRDW